MMDSTLGFQIVTLQHRSRYHYVPMCVEKTVKLIDPLGKMDYLWVSDHTICGIAGPWTGVRGGSSAQMCHACERGIETAFEHAPDHIRARAFSGEKV